MGGVTPCPSLAGANRMRRFYVRPQFRRSGVARALAGAAMQEGLQSSRILTCNAKATPVAGLFWEALGFLPSEKSGLTHLFKL